MDEATPSEAKAALQVDRKQLRSGLKTARKVGAFEGQSVSLTYKSGELVIAAEGHSFRVPADGTWFGEVVVEASFFRGLNRVLPPGGGKLEVSADREMLTIDDISYSCEWNAIEYPRITIPLGARLSNLLQLPMRYSSRAIERSGLSGKLEAAERERDELIRKANKLLIKANDLTLKANDLIHKAGDILSPLGFRGLPPLEADEVRILELLNEFLQEERNE